MPAPEQTQRRAAALAHFTVCLTLHLAASLLSQADGRCPPPALHASIMGVI